MKTKDKTGRKLETTLRTTKADSVGIEALVGDACKPVRLVAVRASEEMSELRCEADSPISPSGCTSGEA